MCVQLCSCGVRIAFRALFYTHAQLYYITLRVTDLTFHCITQNVMVVFTTATSYIHVHNNNTVTVVYSSSSSSSSSNTSKQAKS